MKTKVKTENLLIAVVEVLPTSPEKLLAGKGITSRIMADLFPMGVSVYDYLAQQIPELKPALDAFICKIGPNGADLLEDYPRIRHKAKKVAEYWRLKPEYELPVRRSIRFYLSLFSEISEFPGYPYEEVLASCKEDYPGVAESMLATVVSRTLSKYPVQRCGFELRDWRKRNNPPKGEDDKLKWWLAFHAQIEAQIKELQEKGMPDFFTL